MQILLTIVAFLVIFSVLILIHELGHFTAAKRAGVKVEEFGMGLPPRIWGVKKGETLYSINWIPFGGFVRMLGEDGKASKSKRSFESKTPAAQLWIVSAGVVMNFLLAFVLLTIGFWVGIDPLMTSQEDFYEGLRNEQVLVEPGLVVVETIEEYNTVFYDGEDLDVRSFEPGDRILAVDSLVISDYSDWEEVLVKLETENLMASVDYADGGSGGEYLNLDLIDQLTLNPVNIPRLLYIEDANSVFANVLEGGDVLIRMDGMEIINEEDLYSTISKNTTVSLDVYRPGEGMLTISDLAIPAYHPVITYVIPGSPADLVGIEAGDAVSSIGGIEVWESSLVPDLNSETKASEGQVVYQILRDGNDFEFEITLDESDHVGIAVSDRVDYYRNLSLYQGYMLHSLIEIVPEQHGLVEAPFVAVTEMWRLGKITAVMFLDVFRGFLGAQAVPEGVAGPVGIAQMTFTVVQDGFSSVLRFVALLSLSLGVVNILPIPALDGGRAVFILFRGFTGRKPDPRIENFIHMAGFVLLMLFIVYITFNDVLNLF
ncbi:MAG: regulator of sigma E protease [Oceanicoccus sp.]|jgi:regulator of sigma E protease